MFELLPGLERTAEAVTWVLVHFIWQGTLVAAGLGVVLWSMKGTSAWTRYRCACWALLIVAAMPIVTLGTLIRTGTAEELRSSGEVTAVRESLPVTANPGVGQPSLLESDGVEHLLGMARWSLFAVWLLGATGLSCFHLIGWCRVRTMTTRGVMRVPDRLQQQADSIAHKLGLDLMVRVVQSTLVEVPTVIGWFRPIVLLPLSTLTGLEPRQIEAILAHEIAHIWRRDYIVNLLQVVAETVLFYHPAVWWISGRIREERELCCDDAAVAVTGDRLTLARALLRLDELRRPPLRLVPSAAGGSLFHRITRLLGGETMSRKQTLNFLSATSLVASILVCAGLGWAAIGVNAAVGEAAPATIIGMTPGIYYSPSISGSSGAGDEKRIHGSWEPDRHGDELSLRLRADEGGQRMNIGLALTASETASMSAAVGVFEIQRDAGTFRFSGSVSAGGGGFDFQPDRSFFSDIERYGIVGLDGQEEFVIAATGIDRRWISELDALGYGDELDGETMIALGIHRVTPEYINELASAGIKDEPLEQLLAMRIHGLTVETIEEMRSLGYELEAEELLAWRIHGVDREFIESLAAAGFDDLQPEQLLAMKIHGVSPAWFDEMRVAGLGEIDADMALAMNIHGVSPEFLREFEGLGYANLQAEELVAMRIHGVSPSFIQDVENHGYSAVDVGDLIAMKVHGVTIAFIEEQQADHGSDVSIEELIEAKIMGHRGRYR